MFELPYNFETRKSVITFLYNASIEKYEIMGNNLQDLFQLK